MAKKEKSPKIPFVMNFMDKNITYTITKRRRFIAFWTLIFYQRQVMPSKPESGIKTTVKNFYILINIFSLENIIRDHLKLLQHSDLIIEG